MKKAANGFSLIELLIVVVILGIIAALAVSGFLASKRNANEGSMISTMRLLHGAQMTYATSFGFGEFAGDGTSGTRAGLNALHALGLIDEVVGSGIKSGYSFVGGREISTEALPAQFFFSGVPISIDPITGTGNHRYGITTDGVIRRDTVLTSQFAGVADTLLSPPIGN